MHTGSDLEVVSVERMVQFKHGLLAVRKATALDFHGCASSIVIERAYVGHRNAA